MGMYQGTIVQSVANEIRVMTSDEDESSNYLEHHGIKGQKWGIRRFQNSDGSLTNAGRKRYGIGESKYKIKVQSPFEKEQSKLKAQEKEMSQKEEIMTRKKQLKEREARLKSLGKTEETLRKEELKKLQKQMKKEEKEAKKFKIRQEKEERKLLEKEQKKAEEEVAYRQKQIEKEEKRQKEKDKELTKAITTKSPSKMTTEELRAFIDRYQLEQQYKKIQAANNKSVLKTVTNILASSGQTAMKNVSTNVLTYLLEGFAESTVKGYKDSKDKKKKKNNSGSGDN